MTMRTLMISAGALALAAALGQGPARAESLTLYCAADEAWCQLMAKDFEAETGITVDMTRKSSGEIYAQVKAEAENPKGDIWWAGTGDPHLQAAQEELTEEYESRMMGELHDWAVKQAEAGDHRTVGVYSGALGFGYNKDLLAKNNLPEPKCWADLVKPEYKGHIQIANPNSSGTAYTMLATIVQLMGEDEGFEYMKALHKNINQYTKSGSAPIKAAGLGETTIGIVFLHDAVAQVAAGFPIVPVAPCEGTGYEIGSMSIIAGARNEDEARKFYDWALTADVQSRAQTVNSFQLPSNKNATQSPLAPDLSTIKLIDYDFAKYGSSEERKRLLSKWDEEVSSLPQ
jgi:iron(III) transport system substrate-binding protein